MNRKDVQREIDGELATVFIRLDLRVKELSVARLDALREALMREVERLFFDLGGEENVRAQLQGQTVWLMGPINDEEVVGGTDEQSLELLREAMSLHDPEQS